jgi:hypothetical protein
VLDQNIRSKKEDKNKILQDDNPKTHVEELSGDKILGGKQEDEERRIWI